MATEAVTNKNTVYANEVLANKLTDILTTKVDLQGYMAVDTSLAENPGMKKVINTYTAKGNVEDLDMGEGNTEDISVTFTPTTYTVGVTQGRFQYFDEQAMQDPYVVEAGLDGIAKTMVNDFTKKAITELNKTTLTVTGAADAFTAVVDGLAKLNSETEQDLYLLVAPADLAILRKDLQDKLSYVEDFVRTGYVGHVCGVPVIVSKAVTAGNMFLAAKDAVTLFIKKDTEIEQDREPNIRNNIVYVRKVALVALTDGTKVVKISTTFA